MKDIIIKGARQHNLKNTSVTIPQDKLVVIKGVLAPGTLAFDTLYAKGQRRYSSVALHLLTAVPRSHAQAAC